MRKINWLGHRWYVVGKSTLGNDYIELKRVSFLSDLRSKGSVATVIDTAKSDLKKYNISWE